MVLFDCFVAVRILLMLRTTYRDDVWAVMRGDFLLELLNVCKVQGDCGLAVQCYWEYATLFPEKVMEEFDTRLAEYCETCDAPIIIDMSWCKPGFVACAARFGSASISADEEVELIILFSNMTPLVLSIAGTCVQFVGEQAAAVHIPRIFDILPGTLDEIKSTTRPQTSGRLSIQSITFDMADLPLRLYFPSQVLFSGGVDNTLASFSDITVNWKFMKKLDAFLLDIHSVMCNSLEAKVDLKVKTPLPFIAGHPYPMKLLVRNAQKHMVQVKVTFSCSHVIQAIVDEQPMQRLSETTLIMELQPDGFDERTIIIQGLFKDTLHSSKGLVIRIDAQSNFTREELLSAPKLLADETSHSFINLSAEMIDPFSVEVEYVPWPSDAAIADYPDQGSSRGPEMHKALLKYHAYVQVHCNLDQMTLQSWQLTVENPLAQNRIHLFVGERQEQLLYMPLSSWWAGSLGAWTWFGIWLPFSH